MLNIVVKSLFSSPKFMMIAVAVLALVIIPLTIIQVQNQQNIQQHAWLTTQSASASCPVGAAGVEITVTFTNTEPLDPTLSMDVTALDQQSGKSVDMGSIKGGETKTNKIQTGKATLANGNVVFSQKSNPIYPFRYCTDRCSADNLFTATATDLSTTSLVYHSICHCCL